MSILSLNQPDPNDDPDLIPTREEDARGLRDDSRVSHHDTLTIREATPSAKEDTRSSRDEDRTPPRRARVQREVLRSNSDDARGNREDARNNREDALLPSREKNRPTRLSVRDEDDDSSNARDDARGHEDDARSSREETARIQLRSDRPTTTPVNSALASLDDNTLLVRIRNGVEDALGTLYDRYGKMLYSVALRVLRDPTAAEDVLCDIFMDIWRNSENYLAIRGPLAGWLAVLARNRSIDALRRKRPISTLEDILLASNFDLAQEPERNTLMEKARSVIQALPTDQRKSLEMAFFDGLTHIEIAEMTGDTEVIIRTRLRSALLTLRKAMQA